MSDENPAIASVTKCYHEGEVLNYELKYSDGSGWSVPIDIGNRRYNAILKWVAEGNTIEEPA